MVFQLARPNQLPGRLGDARRSDLLDITNALKRIPGWTNMPGRKRVPNYGPQLVFARQEKLI